MLHDAAPARLSAYFVSFVFVSPYLSQPPARGIYRLWDRYQPPLARLSHSRNAVACKAHERRRNPPQVSGRP